MILVIGRGPENARASRSPMADLDRSIAGEPPAPGAWSLWGIILLLELRLGGPRNGRGNGGTRSKPELGLSPRLKSRGRGIVGRHKRCTNVVRSHARRFL